MAKQKTNEEEKEECPHDLIPRAIIFAFNAHSGQYRKISGQQYIIHPLRISEFLLLNFRSHPDLDSLRAAAILHDTIEDTWASEKEIEHEFGEKISSLVKELTKPEFPDKKERHTNYLGTLKNGSDNAKIIKLADIYDNVVLSTNEDPKWKNFLLESKEILEEMKLKKQNIKYNNLKTQLINIIDEKLKKYEQN